MELKGIGEKNAALFHKLNIETIEDLLYHFPKSYESLPPVISVQEAKEQQISDPAILATVKTTPVPVHVRNLSILKLQAEDAHGALLHISFFNMPYLKNTLKAGTQYVFHGAVQEKGGSLFMSHPKLYQPAEYQKLQGKLLSVYANERADQPGYIQVCPASSGKNSGYARNTSTGSFGKISVLFCEGSIKYDPFSIGYGKPGKCQKTFLL